MKTFLKTMSFLLFFYFSNCYSDILILSDKLKLNYESPILISHTQDSLIVKYKDWNFFHVVVNPKTIYSNIDLTGVEKEFLISIFDIQKRQNLPNWLASLSTEQSKEFGVGSNNVYKSNIGKVKILGVYDKNRSAGYIYVFEELKTHNFVVYGTKSQYLSLINNIKVR